MNGHDLKKQYERAIADELLEACSVQTEFVRYGNDRDEPDVIYRLPNEETLGIEVATAYYEDSDAKQEWTLARGDRPHPPDGVELRLGGPIKEPDKLMCERVQRELVDKCHRRYSGVVHVWLCIKRHAVLDDRETVEECTGLLTVPTEHAFEAIYVTYQDCRRGGAVQAIRIATTPRIGSSFSAQ
jgi:hypothetical protein